MEHDEIGIGLFPSEDSMVEVRDVNFDGYEDITVHKGNYGVQGTKIYEAYIWDEDTKSLIWNESFNVIPNPEIDYENEVVLGENRESSLSYDYFVYKYEHGEYVNTDIMNATFVEDENMHVIEKKLIDNEMKEVFNDIVSYEEYKERYEQMIKSSALEVTPTPEPNMEESDDKTLPDNIARYYTKDNYQEEITHEEFKELMKSYSFEEKEDSYWGFSRKEEYVATEYDFSEEVIREILSVKK